jgi:hypothetical protein
MKTAQRWWIVPLAVCVLVGRADGASSHLWWNGKGHEAATCAYGEITILATHPPIYYCGLNWHPGEAAGGYCGLQHNGATEKRTIFSIWDTAPQLHPAVTFADPQTVHNRFGGEGEGGHTHMLWNWQVGETFRYFVQKVPGAKAGTTDARYFIYDAAAQRWRHSATITSPNGEAASAKSVATLGGGGLCSFLENFGGNQEAEVPKLALYRLWLGTEPSKLQCLTEVAGNRQWGKFGDCYYLAEGTDARLDEVFARWKEHYGVPVRGESNQKLDPISNRPPEPAVLRGLEAALQSPAVR